MNLQLVYRYILSLSKNENLFYEKTTTKKKVPKRGKKGSIGESRTKDIFNTFAHDILPVDAIWSP